MINVIINSDMFSCNIILPEKEALKFIQNIYELYMKKFYIYNKLHCKFQKL